MRQKIHRDIVLIMETLGRLQREKFSTYYLVLFLVSGLALLEVFLGWYLVSYDFGRFSYIRILLTIAVLIGLWVQSHAARYIGAIWLLLSVGAWYGWDFGLG